MDGNNMSNLLTQENLDEGHDDLDRLMRRVDRARRQACKEGNVGLRNQLAAGHSHLMMAYSVLGGINESGVAPKSGDK